MKAKSISHIAVCVSDLDRSLAFYQGILGMTVSLDTVQDTRGGSRTYTYKNERDTRRVAHLSWGEDQEPYLVMTCHPGSQPDGAPIKLDQIGVSHFSFTVDDVLGLANELVAKGVEIPGGIQAFTNAKGEVSSFYVTDPDGILVQFDGGSAA
ncbi:MAG: VOC family protein [Chloroflexi bacterium]|nr:VOC family protein [Chloroflexota bacterium]MDA1270620.1 VOC family protein [Chloroflexota bacterium]